MTEVAEEVGTACPADTAGRAQFLPSERPTIMTVAPQLARLVDTNVDSDVKLIYAELVRVFPEITHVYGGSNSPDHNNRRCLDLMVVDLSGDFVGARGMRNLTWAGQRALGDRIVAYLKANAVRLGVNGLIWNHAGDDAKVMGFPHAGGQNSYRGPYGVWRDYSKPKTHSDHVHVELDGSPYIPPPGTVPAVYPPPASGEVYVDKLTAGQADSDSVAYVQLALAKVLGMTLPATGTYDTATVAAAREYQRRLGDTLVDGLLGPLQTLQLMKDAGMAVTVFRDSKAGGIVTRDQAPADPDPEPTPAPVPPKPPTTPEPTMSHEFVVVEANIRRRTQIVPGFPGWVLRRNNVVKAMLAPNPDVIIACETDPTTRKDIGARLGSGWTWWGYGPLGIFWRSGGKFERQRDASRQIEYRDKENRRLLSLPLVHLAAGRTIYFDGTHFENDGDTATDGHRARYIESSHMAELTDTGDRVFGADINSTTRTATGTAKGASTRSKQKPRPVLAARAGWRMLTDLSSGLVANRVWASHHGGKGKRPNGAWIDELGIRGKLTFVRGGLVDTSKTKASDHHFVWARIKITN